MKQIPNEMKTLKFTFLVLLMISTVLLVNCKPEEEDEFPLDGNNISMADIAGSWTATYAQFHNANANPPVRTEILEEGGSVTLVIQTNGRFTFTISFPGENPEVSKGQLGFEEDYLVVRYDDDPDEYEYMGIQLSTDHRQLFISGPTEFDFNDDGIEEPAQVSLELVRN